MPASGSVRLDVFCRVVDNYGDAGVCWRLARELVAEHGLDVTLRIDRLEALARIEPAIDAPRIEQRAAGVTVRALDEHSRPAHLPDVVVEAFGCGLPRPWLEAMAAAQRKPLWINLEYLSAETWVDGAHALPSPHPRLPLVRHFWFPGFTASTGGLIRERDLFAKRDAWQARHAPAGDTLRVVLFGYENRALPALLEHWACGDESVACVIPEGVAVRSLASWLGTSLDRDARPLTRGKLSVERVPFTTQDGFDRMLWDADVNFVRGEDSFVRAQWAARAFVWQPYRQADDAHLVKLRAFLDRYAQGLAADAARALVEFSSAYNREDVLHVAAAWDALCMHRVALAAHARQWARTLARGPELGASLVDFIRNRL
jgi:uncharacterized repeat protein (TIGR03837 family)